MLERLDSIKKVGLFDDYKHSPECSLGEVTLIYGENGVGKSTIAAILDSLREGNEGEITRRTTLPGDLPPSVVVTLNGTIYTFNGSAWDAQPPYDTLDVFFPGFVSRNVHAVSAVDPGHRRNLCELVLGREAVTKVTRLALADGEARTALAEKNRVEASIKLLIKAPDTLETFLGLPNDPQLDEKLEKARTELKQAQAKESIIAKPIPRSVQLPTVDRDVVSALLQRNSQDIGADVATIVRQHISRNLDPDGEIWLAYGARHTQDNKCPFCAQNLDCSTIAVAIREYFSAEYQAYTESLEAEIDGIRESLGSAAFQQTRLELTAQIAVAMQWADEFPVDQASIESSFDAAETAWNRGATKLGELVATKMAQPLARMNPSSAEEALEAYHQALELLVGVNAVLSECSEKAEKKKKALSQTEIAAAEARVNQFENKKVRFEPLAQDLLTRRNDLLVQRKDLDVEKTALKKEIDDHGARVAGKYQDGINYYLKHFGCDIHIESVETKFPSGKAIVQYKLKAHGHEIPLGCSDTVPCFDTVLSEGDKCTFALSFFFARLKSYKDLSGRVVVLDDPVNSLGSSRRRLIEAVICDLRKRGSQVVVLTHDERLAALMWRDTRLKGILPLQIQRTQNGSQILAWDVERALQSDYVQDYLVLTDFLLVGGAHQPASSRIRPYVEQRLRHMYPALFHTRDTLGQMIGNIRDSKFGSRLYGLIDKLSELEAINDAALPSHHATDDVPGLEPLTPEEVRLFVGKALDVLG